MTTELPAVLKQSAVDHTHLCPRQLLGVGMGLAGLARLDLQAPVTAKTSLIIIEAAGCTADGIGAAMGATVGYRTLRVEDLGKIAATFTDLQHGISLHLAPKADVRTRTLAYTPEEPRRYFAQLIGYKVMPDSELFNFQPVELRTPAQLLISHQNARTACSACGEEIINEREVLVDGKVLCPRVPERGTT
jgi:formylmethanofuran dehydrogenase subunit E